MYTKSMNRKYTKEQIQKVAELLSNDNKREIREELDCHRNHVYKVLSLQYYDQKVIDKALEILANHAERKAAIEGLLIEAFEALEKLNLIAKI